MTSPSLHKDVPDGIRAVAAAGVRLITLSNGSAQIARKLFSDARIREGPQVSRPTVAKWVARFPCSRATSLVGRSSRPHSSSNQCTERTDLPHSTVSRACGCAKPNGSAPVREENSGDAGANWREEIRPPFSQACNTTRVGVGHAFLHSHRQNTAGSPRSLYLENQLRP